MTTFISIATIFLAVFALGFIVLFVPRGTLTVFASYFIMGQVAANADKFSDWVNSSMIVPVILFACFSMALTLDIAMIKAGKVAPE